MLKLKKSAKLNEVNSNNFELDLLIIDQRKNNTLTNQEFCKLHNIKPMAYAGRVTSLVKRGHLAKSGKTPQSIKTIIQEVSAPTFRMTDDKKNAIINDINNGVALLTMVKNHGVSLSTVSRIKLSLKTLKSLPKVPKNTYSNVSGENKEIARNKMAKYIIDSDVIGLIPTLPHIACTIEKKILLERDNYTFIGIERDEETYKKLRSTVKKEGLPITPYFGDISSKIYGQIEDAYAHLILDYCGVLPTVAKEIEYAINNRIVQRGGIIAITFAKPIRTSDELSQQIKALGATISNNVNDNRCASDRAVEAYFNSIIGKDFQFVEVFNYSDKKDNEKGYPMTLIVLKRK